MDSHSNIISLAKIRKRTQAPPMSWKASKPVKKPKGVRRTERLTSGATSGWLQSRNKKAPPTIDLVSDDDEDVRPGVRYVVCELRPLPARVDSPSSDETEDGFLDEAEVARAKELYVANLRQGQAEQRERELMDKEDILSVSFNRPLKRSRAAFFN